MTQADEVLYRYVSPGTARTSLELSIFADPDGLARLQTEEKGPGTGAAGMEIYLPASEVMPLCAALYRAVGDKEPQLHAAVGGAEVRRLGALIKGHLRMADYILSDAGCNALARDILVSGYARPEDED